MMDENGKKGKIDVFAPFSTVNLISTVLYFPLAMGLILPIYSVDTLWRFLLSLGQFFYFHDKLLHMVCRDV